MEPNILASTHKSAAPGAEGWPPQTGDSAWAPPGDGTAVAASPAVVNGTHAMAGSTGGATVTVRHGGNGHVSSYGNGNGNGTARWPELVPVPGGALAQTLPIYEAPGETGLYLRFGKRLLDVLGASLGLLLSLPLLLLAAILIKLESRGPVIYRSIRIGRGARPFTFFKLRSMVDGADQYRHKLSHLNESDGPVFKIAADPRVTRIGRLFRVTSVDEIPQLWNVLRGEMSLVGPRPPIAEEVVQYEPWQLRRLDVVPGITCLWQISGRSRIGFQEWMRLDLEYIRHRSFWLDLKILIRTIPAVLSREGAY
jgi:lipopolysaccharide/colanic/teichoic acid biosynthesis glycosyltransferase